ncbi:MAG: glycoside hydrolase family 113 [Bryobacteraceae bacterium]
MLALTGWAFAAFWTARLLLWGVPALLLDPAAKLNVSPWGLAAMGANHYPWLGLALAIAFGFCVRDRGPILWIAAGLALCERLGGPRGFQFEWIHAAAIGVFALGVHRSAMGVWPLALGVLLPQILLRLAIFRFRVGWEHAALLGLAGALLIGIVAYRRPKWETAHWRPWPGFAASALLLLASLVGSQWIQSRDAAARQAALASLPKSDPAAPYLFDYFHKGVSFTAEGISYDAPQARTMLAKLPAFGVNAIALVPYGFSPRGETKIRIPGRGDTWESEDGMEILTSDAHRMGLRVMLKPHVWRLQGRTPIPDAEVRQWLAEYRPFIEHYAQFAVRVHADIFCIGTELRGLTQHESEWRDIISRVRKIYKGPIVYAANHGEEFETIRFWDALDYIGIDNYYPLDDDYSAATLLGKIEAIEQKFRKPVLFTEAGFGAHRHSHREPWEDETAKPLDLAEQARSYEGLLNAVYKKPWFRGVYWWKVGTNGYGGPDNNSMTPWRKPAMDVVKRFYLLPAP